MFTLSEKIKTVLNNAIFNDLTENDAATQLLRIESFYYVTLILKDKRTDEAAREILNHVENILGTYYRSDDVCETPSSTIYSHGRNFMGVVTYLLSEEKEKEIKELFNLPLDSLDSLGSKAYVDDTALREIARVAHQWNFWACCELLYPHLEDETKVSLNAIASTASMFKEEDSTLVPNLPNRKRVISTVFDYLSNLTLIALGSHNNSILCNKYSLVSEILAVLLYSGTLPSNQGYPTELVASVFGMSEEELEKLSEDDITASLEAVVGYMMLEPEIRDLFFHEGNDFTEGRKAALFAINPSLK